MACTTHDFKKKSYRKLRKFGKRRIHYPLMKDPNGVYWAVICLDRLADVIENAYPENVNNINKLLERLRRLSATIRMVSKVNSTLLVQCKCAHTQV